MAIETVRIERAEIIGQLEAAKVELKKHEDVFKKILDSFGACFKIAVYESKKDCERILRELRQGKWIIRARCEDGTCYWDEGSWADVWYDAHCYENEAEAQLIIQKIKNTPTDMMIGRFMAVQL